MLRKVKLYGILGERFGKEWELDINSVREALQAIAANNPEFRREFVSSHERGIGYQVIVGDSYLNDEEEAGYPTGSQEIKIIPAVMGAKKRGLGQILVGALMLYVMFQTGMTFTGGEVMGVGDAIGVGAGQIFGSTLGPMAVKFGAALVLGGIAAMLAPSPKSLDTAEKPKNYGFDGPVNTTKQGYAVPVCYGKLIVGGAVISAGIQAEDYDPA